MKLKNDKVWVLGGYGDVGFETARILVEEYNLDVVLVGRNSEKANRAARHLGPRARACRVDVSSDTAGGELAGAQFILNTVEDISPSCLEELFKRGATFVDISASPNYLETLKGLANRLPAAGLVVTDVGLSPGLTNILAGDLAMRSPSVAKLNILLVFDMGKHHGTHAVEWFLSAMGSPYQVIENGKAETRTPGNTRKWFDVNSLAAKRLKGFGMGFSDQIAIAEKSGLASVKTYCAVTPGWMNVAVNILLDTGLNKLLPRFASPVTRALKRFPERGPGGTLLVLEAISQSCKLIASQELSLPDQSIATARLAALAVAKSMSKGGSGSISSTDLIDADEALSCFERGDLRGAVA